MRSPRSSIIAALHRIEAVGAERNPSTAVSATARTRCAVPAFRPFAAAAKRAAREDHGRVSHAGAGMRAAPGRRGAACRRPSAEKARATARKLVEDVARQDASGGGVEGLIQEYSLSSQEGVALMCLAEALLRIPDRATRDALIRDKIALGRLGQPRRARRPRCSSTPRPGACGHRQADRHDQRGRA